MKNNLQKAIAAVIVVAHICTGCTGIPARTGPANADLIRTSAIDAGERLAAVPILVGARRVAVIPIERAGNGDRDRPVQAVIEDAVYESFNKAGIGILERDPDVVRRLMYQEEGSTMENAVYGPDELSGADGFDSHVGGRDLISGQTQASAGNGRAGSNLATADLVVAYRIVDAGLRYEEIEYSSDVARTSITRLHVRILDAKKGGVLWAGEITGTASDQIDRRFVPAAEHDGLSYYAPGLPLQTKADGGSPPVLPPPTKDKFPWWIFLVVAAVGAAGYATTAR